jgi:hypothetical protein
MTARDLLGRVLISAVAAEVGILPIIIDLSPSHVFNPGWPAHARLHGVWLLASGGLMALVALYLTWFYRANRVVAVTMAGVLLGIILGGFFAAVATAPLYGGQIVDSADAAVMAQDMIVGIPANLFVFSVAAIILAIGVLLAMRAARATASAPSAAAP